MSFLNLMNFSSNGRALTGLVSPWFTLISIKWNNIQKQPFTACFSTKNNIFKTESFEHDGQTYSYYPLTQPRFHKNLSSNNCHDLDIAHSLPYSIRVLYESAIRNFDGAMIKEQDVENILNWQQSQAKTEIPFKPSRVLLQDFTGVPCMVDLASMREAMKTLGGDSNKVNPSVPVDLVVDHSIQVDHTGSLEAVRKNEQLELSRNKERFQFLKWGANAFKNVLIIPPGSGIVHQVNLEYLVRIVFSKKEKTGDILLYPDSLVGTDSHTTMINGLGIVGWGVGGIEAEAVMLGESTSMLLPSVVGIKLEGKPHDRITATDIVLTVTEFLRKIGVVGKFVEFYGPGLNSLTLADRATIANMAPEYGATMGYFPIDNETLRYALQTGRDPKLISLYEKYLKKANLFLNPQDPIKYTTTYTLDLASIKPCVAGPKRPQDRVPLSDMKTDFKNCLTAPAGFKGFGIQSSTATNDGIPLPIPFEYRGQEYALGHGSVVIASITSCTNTSNPGVMLAAGLLAKKAVEKGLIVKPYIKTSISPGSKVVQAYYEASGLDKYLEKLGFYIAGYGCMTCIGNSGALDDTISKVIEHNNLVVASILSGNRNFEGRVHPLTKANYLASPPLVIAYALAGRCDIDFENDSLGVGKDGSLIYLKDIWPTKKEIENIEAKHIKGTMFEKIYSTITDANTDWARLSVKDGHLYDWDQRSSYIRRAPFFDSVENSEINQENDKKLKGIQDARVLLKLGDSITTDHISPAGNIASSSPAARYLESKGIVKANFNTYGSRRGNHEVMLRGTFANTRIENSLCPGKGPVTKHFPSGKVGAVSDIAQIYTEQKVPLILLAGSDYGSGSSRDWAAKGPALLGVRAIIACSFERIHRSNLVGMGILPLQFNSKENADSLGLNGQEEFTIKPQSIIPGGEVVVDAITPDGKKISFSTICRIDTDIEIKYYQSGGVLPFVLQKLMSSTE